MSNSLNSNAVVANNTKKLAEARVLASVAAGTAANINAQVAALNDLAIQQDAAIGAVIRDMAPTVEIKVRRKKGAKGGNAGTTPSLATTARNVASTVTGGLLVLALFGFMSGTMGAATHNDPMWKNFGLRKSEVLLCINRLGGVCDNLAQCEGIWLDNVKILENKGANGCGSNGENLAKILNCVSNSGSLAQSHVNRLKKLSELCDNEPIEIGGRMAGPASVICSIVGCDTLQRRQIIKTLEALLASGDEMKPVVQGLQSDISKIEERLSVNSNQIKQTPLTKDIQNMFIVELKNVLDKMVSTVNSLNNKYGGRYTKIQDKINSVFELLRHNFDIVEKEVSMLESATSTLNKIDGEIQNVQETLVRHRREIKEETAYWSKYGLSGQLVQECYATMNIICTSEEACSSKSKEFFDGLAKAHVEEQNCKDQKIKINEHRRCMNDHSVLIQEFNGAASAYATRCFTYARCKSQVKSTVQTLKQLVGDSIKEEEVNEKNCQSKLEDLNSKYTSIKRFGHNSGIKLETRKRDQCAEQANWKEQGWLGGVSGSCVSGVDGLMWNARECIKEPYGKCLHGKSDNCILTYNNATLVDGQLLSNTHRALAKPVCCTMPCFKMEDLYLVFTHQPLCLSCLKPFSVSFWTDSCLTTRTGAAISIRIYSSVTEFDMANGETVTCSNGYGFPQCCAGKGPAPRGSRDVFKDKHCVCVLNAPTGLDLILAKLNTLKQKFFVVEHLMFFATIFLVFCVRKSVGIALLVVYLAWLVVSVDGACSVENMVPSSASMELASAGAPFDHLRVRPGQCFMAGDATIEIVSIKLFHIYNFLRAIPYKIKPVCQVFDWGCAGGLSDGVYSQESECYKTCVPGLRKQFKSSEADWIGDHCFLDGRVATRLDVCFSYGEISSFVDLYTIVSGVPHVELTVKFHGLGFESIGHLTTSSMDTNLPVRIFNVQTTPSMWPQMISYRLSKYLCAYHYVESSNTCNSGDVFKPADIDADCLDLRQKWNIEHGGYSMTFGQKDFETQLHNSFINCPLKSSINNSATTLRYYEDSDWVEFDIAVKKLVLASSVERCASLALWKIESESGLTGYHRTTKVIYSNSGKRCRLFVELEDCISTNGQLIVLGNGEGEHIVEYWCAGNASGKAYITLANDIVEVKSLTVLHNFAPHKNTIRNSFERLIRAGSVNDISTAWSNFCENLKLGEWYHSITGWFSNLFQFGILKLVISLVLGVAAWNCFTRGNMVGLAFCGLMFWLLILTKIVLASPRSADPVIFVATNIGDWLFVLILVLVKTLISFPGRATSFLCFVVRSLISSIIWFLNIMTEFSVVDVEYCLNLVFECFAALLLTGRYSWVGAGLTFVIVGYLRLGHLINLSPVVNRHRLTLSPLSAISTWFERSGVASSVNDVSNAYNTMDAAVADNSHKLAAAINHLFCSPKKLSTVPVVGHGQEDVLYATRGPAGIVYYGKINRTCHYSIMAHCVEEVEDFKNDRAIVSKGFRELILENKVQLPVFPLERGSSGMIRVSDGEIEWFCGFRSGEPVWTKAVQEGRKSSVIFSPCINKSKAYIVLDAQSVIFASPEKDLPSSPVEGEIVSEGLKSTGAIPKKPKESQTTPTETVVDGNGTKYLNTPTGLRNTLMWASHSAPTEGYLACGDVALITGQERLYAGCSKLNDSRFGIRKFAVETFTWNGNQSSRLNVIPEGQLWWSVVNTPENARKETILQRSYCFKYEGNLKSGTIIYVYPTCFSAPVPISVVTKSFKVENQQYYIISRPCDERVAVSFANVRKDVEARNHCPRANEGIKASAWSLKKKGSVYEFCLLNTEDHSVFRSEQDLPFVAFDQLVNHSPISEKTETQIVAIAEAMGIRVDGELFSNKRVRKLLKVLEETMVPDDVVRTLPLVSELDRLQMVEANNYRKTALRIRNASARGVQMSTRSPWFENWRKLLSTDASVGPPEELPAVESEVDDAYVWSTTTQVASISVAARIHIFVTSDEEQFGLNVASEGLVIDITGDGDYIRRHVKNKIVHLVARGVRYLYLNCAQPYWGDGKEYAGELSLPEMFSFVTCVWVRSTDPEGFKVYYKGPQATREWLIVDRPEDVIPRGWRNIGVPQHVQDSNTILVDHAAHWKRVTPSDGSELRTCNVVGGRDISTLAECGLSSGYLNICLIRNVVSRGSAFIIGDSLITSYHVTKGRRVRLNHNGYRYDFGEPKYSSKTQDICMYGDHIKFVPMVPGEIVVAFNPLTKFGLYFMVDSVSTTLEGRPGAMFARLMPVKIGVKGTVIPCGYHYGCSGSPIVNRSGQCVGVFGLGTDVWVSAEGGVATVAHYSPVGEVKLTNLSFFERCALNFVDKELGVDNVAYYLNAPTGVGKTTKFPLALAQVLSTRHDAYTCRKVLVCQPNVDAVKGGATRAGFGATALNLKNIRIKYVVGLQNAESTMTVLDCDAPVVEIVFKTYGKQMADLRDLDDYHYIILDEVHVIGDADVVALMVYLETKYANFPKKCLYMSASHISNNKLLDAADGMTLSGSPHSIVPQSWQIVGGDQKNKPSRIEGGFLYLNKDIIKKKRDGYIKIDMRYLSEKTTVFFCATRSDCEAGAAFANENGVAAFAYHAKSKQEVFQQILRREERTWVFATNVIQQSVTIPNLVTVVDFGTECRPRLSIGNCPLTYKLEIESRQIDMGTQLQRKGRVGRTGSGIYVSSPVASEPTRVVETYVMADVALKLAEVLPDLESVRCSNQYICDEIRKLAWLHPSRMVKAVSENQADYLPREVSEIMRTKSCSLDFTWKLSALKQKVVDPVKWYVRAWATKEELAFLRSEACQFCDEIKRRLPVIPQEAEDNFSEFWSFQDLYDEKKRSKGAEGGDRLDVMEFVDDIAEAEMHEMSMSAIPAALLVSIGMGMGLYELLDRKCARYVTHMVSVENSKVPATAKYFAEANLPKNEVSQVVDAGRLLGTAAKEISIYIKNRSSVIYKIFPFLKRPEGVEMADIDWPVVLNGFSAMVLDNLNNWAKIFSLSLGTTLGSLSGGGILGLIYSDLKKHMGASLAMIVGAIIHGIASAMLSLNAYSIMAVSQIIFMLIRSVYNAATSKDSALYKPNTSSSGDFWSAIISAGLGVGAASVVGMGIFQGMSQAQSIVHKEVQLAAPNVGHVGVPILLVKHAYHLIKRSSGMGDVIGSSLSVLGLVCEAGPLTLLYAGALAVIVAIAEMGAEQIIDKYASREYTGAGGVQHYEARRATLKRVVGWVLDGAALVVYPASLISVLIGGIGMCIRGSNAREAFSTSWEQNTGVSPIAALISEIWRGIRSMRSEQVQMNEGWIDTFGSMMSSIMSCLYEKGKWLGNAIKDAVKRGIKSLKTWILSLFRRDIGRPIGAGVADGIRNALGENWFTKTLLRIEEQPAVEGVRMNTSDYNRLGAKMIDRYLAKKIRPLDSMWLEVGAGSCVTSGRLLENILVDSLRTKAPIKVSTLKTSEPLVLYKIPMDQLKEFINNVIGNVKLENDEMTVELPMPMGQTMSLSFTNTFDENVMYSVIRVKLATLCADWFFEFRSNGSATEMTCLEYGCTDGLSDRVWKILPMCTGLITGEIKTAEGAEARAAHGRIFGLETNLVGQQGILSKLANKAVSSLNSVIAGYSDIVEKGLGVGHPADKWLLEDLYDRVSVPDEYHSYCRYWQYYISKAEHLCAPVTNHSYMDPKWNLIQGYKPIWLSKPSCQNGPVQSEMEEIKYGFRLKDELYKWNTPFLVTNNVAYTRKMLEIFNMNAGVPIKFVYKGMDGCIYEDWLLFGAKTEVTYIEVALIGLSYYACVRGSDKEIAIEILTLEEHTTALNECLEKSGKILQINSLVNICNNKATTEREKLWQKLNRGVKQPEIVEGTNWLAVVMSAVGEAAQAATSTISKVANNLLKKDPVKEMSETWAHRVMEFIKSQVLADETHGDSVLERINLLLTATQQEEILMARAPRFELSESEDEFLDACAEKIIDNRFAVGFTEATKGYLKDWTWFKSVKNSSTPLGIPIQPAEVMRQYKLLNDMKATKQKWEALRYITRYRLPSSIEKLESGEEHKAASRAYYKMQQLYEADPAFFANCKAIMDPACGYGGFAQYLSNKMANMGPKTLLVGSMLEKGHRIPDMNRLTCTGSNCHVVSMVRPELDDGDIRDPSVLNRYLEAAHKIDGLDLLIFDIGEFFTNSSSQFKWWTNKPADKTSLVEAMAQLQKSLRSGGKMLMKWTGYFEGGETLLKKLLGRFASFKAIKVGTSSLYSPEFYILASGYKGEIISSGKVSEFYGVVGEQLYSQFVRAAHVWRHERDFSSMERGDWEYPKTSGMHYVIDTHNSKRPGGLSWDLKFGNQHLKETWVPDWDSRLTQFHAVLRKELYGETPKRKLRYTKGSTGTYQKLYQDGWFTRPIKDVQLKHSKNALLDSLCWATTKTTDLNSTMGQCQATPEFKDASVKKRLDFEAPVLPAYILEELAEILELMTSEFGKKLLGKCRLMGKNRVLEMMNKNGATSVLSKESNLRNFVEKHDDWYEMCMFYCVQRWQKGLPTHTFFSIMHKNEAKAKKNVEEGSICLEKGHEMHYEPEELREELRKYCDLPHRFIQYADEISRIAHYIVFGELLEWNSKQKIYKGTVNGCPPSHLGNVLRAVWDLNIPEDDKKTFRVTHHKGKEVRQQMGADLWINSHKGEDSLRPESQDVPCGLSIDYSSWDGSVSVGERMIEANYFASFYIPELRQCIMNCCREMAFAICLDHDGNLVLRSGHRGSGEILTSIGNTALVAANTFRAIAKVTGLTFKQLLETVAVVSVDIGGRVKNYEITMIPQFSDGDDTVILTTSGIAKKISANIDSELLLAGKKIRSGQKSGCATSMTFEGVDFCSHHYESILVGPEAQYISARPSQHPKICAAFPQYRIRHLPTRPTTDVVGKLRATLKQQGLVYKPEDDRPGSSKDITRSKLASYALLYPHCRYVRYLVLSGLVVTGDGSIDFHELSKRYPDMKAMLTRTTLMGALRSVYGVDSLNDIGLRDYQRDKREGRLLKRHARLIGENLDMRLQSHVARCGTWLLSQKHRYWEVALCDSKFTTMLYRAVASGHVRMSHKEANRLRDMLGQTKAQIKLLTEEVEHPLSIFSENKRSDWKLTTLLKRALL